MKTEKYDQIIWTGSNRKSKEGEKMRTNKTRGGVGEVNSN